MKLFARRRPEAGAEGGVRSMRAVRDVGAVREVHDELDERAAAATGINPATWASAQELIALRRHAGQIGLQCAGPARAQRGGEHLSRFRGRGMDYQESRAYSDGDDVRSMDWRVTARTGLAHVKVYQEERERPVVFGIDFNPGMYFGSRGRLKSVVATHAAALLAWAAADNGDRVGALLYNGGTCDLAPRGGAHGVLQLIRQLVAHSDPRQGIDARPGAGGLGAALVRLRRVSRPGSLIVLIGDFYGLDDDCDRQLQWLRRHNDVVALQIVDPLELAPPQPARYGVFVGGQRCVLDLRPAAARRAYQECFGRHHDLVAATMRRHAISLLRLPTDADTLGALRRHFAHGKRRAPEHRLAA
jgi:uncharacterized protein (DUF58 family)